jgi:hypothetical protein
VPHFSRPLREVGSSAIRGAGIGGGVGTVPLALFSLVACMVKVND